MAIDTRRGIDLGGTKIEGVVLDSGSNPEVLCRKRLATQGAKGYDHYLRLLCKPKLLSQNLATAHGSSVPRFYER